MTDTICYVKEQGGKLRQDNADFFLTIIIEKASGNSNIICSQFKHNNKMSQ